jgi:type VI secretion system protein ImpF
MRVRELAPQERLQPALLDRLTDEEPDKQVEGPDKRVLNKVQLRQAVLRDLVWLFNTTRLESSEDLSNAPNVRSSVLNFGLPALSGATASTLDPTDLERAVRDAIIAFEPRILAPSLRVRAVVSDTQLDQHNVISVQIEGQLWAQPVPLEVLLRTNVDLETGKVEIMELATPLVA